MNIFSDFIEQDFNNKNIFDLVSFLKNEINEKELTFSIKKDDSVSWKIVLCKIYLLSKKYINIQNVKNPLYFYNKLFSSKNNSLYSILNTFSIPNNRSSFLIEIESNNFTPIENKIEFFNILMTISIINENVWEIKLEIDTDDEESEDNESDDNESDDNESDDEESDDEESDDDESDDEESDDEESDDKKAEDDTSDIENNKTTYSSSGEKK